MVGGGAIGFVCQHFVRGTHPWPPYSQSNHCGADNVLCYRLPGVPHCCYPNTMYYVGLGGVKPLWLSPRVLIFVVVGVWTSDAAHLVTDCICYPLLVLLTLAAVQQLPYPRYGFPINAATMSAYH